MLHLSLIHFAHILSCHIFDEYKCSQLRCGRIFKTLGGLLAHEQMKHRALDLFFGTIIENDMFKEIEF